MHCIERVCHELAGSTREVRDGLWHPVSQISELLSEVAPAKEQKNTALELYLKTLREFLVSLPSEAEISVRTSLTHVTVLGLVEGKREVGR